MHSIQKSMSLVASIALLGSCAYGATLSGTVKGPDGAPFKGAFVQAQNNKTRITVSVLSGKDGRYRADDLPAGEYDSRIRAIGYRGDARTGITLAASQTATFDWALQKGIARWSDLTLYQGEKLLPNLPGKELLFGPTAAGGRDAPCPDIRPIDECAESSYDCRAVSNPQDSQAGENDVPQTLAFGSGRSDRFSTDFFRF